MTKEIIEVEAESLAAASEQLKVQIATDLYWLSKEVISDGRPQRVQATADTLEAAFAKAQDKLPIDATILEKREVTMPKQKVMSVAAFDELNAIADATWTARKEMGYKPLVKRVKVASAGRSGLLGLGKKPHLYEVELLQPAVVEISYQPKAKILARLEKVETDPSVCLAAGNLELQFEVQARNVTLKGSQTQQAEESFTLQVVLGSDYFSYRDHQFQRIYDFANRRIITIHLPEKIYVDDSLFAEVGCRVAEFQHRLWISSSLQATGINHPAVGDFVQNEHLFSLRMKAGLPHLRERTAGAMLIFESHSEQLLAHSLEALTVTEAQMAMFIKFVRYYLGGHPLILEKLGREAHIPRLLKIILNDTAFDTRIRQLTLTSARPVPDILYTFGLNPGVLSTDPDDCAQLIHQTRYEAGQRPAQRAEAIAAQARQAFAQGNHFAAWLAYIEYNLQTGLPLPTLSVGQLECLPYDENVEQVIMALRANHVIEAQAAVATFQALRQEEVSRGYEHLLLIFEANMQINLGHYEQARELLLQALRQNPYLAGVYKDLGDLYYDQQNPCQAWRCWDLGRKLAPHHPLFRDVETFEEKLVGECTGYF